MGMIYLAEITAAIDTVGNTTTLRFSTGKGYNHPSAPGFYEPRIKQPANIKREIFDDLRTYGASKVSYGELVLLNTDHALDYMLDYGYGRTATLLLGDEDAAYNTFATVLTGIIEQPVFSVTATSSQVSCRFRDRQQELDKPIQPTKFAGTNSGATGIEGTADTIKGQPKPRLWGGKAPNITPVLLNSSKLIYGVNFDRAGSTAAVNAITNVNDKGVVLTFSADYANLAALQAAVIAGGSYATCLAAGLIRLGSSLSGAITCDVTQGATSADRRIAGVMKALLLDAGVPNGNISSSNITTLDSDAPYEVYYYTDGQEGTYRDALDKVGNSAFVWYAPDKNNSYQIKQLKTPSGTAAFTFKSFTSLAVAKASEGDIISIERLATSDDGRGVPSYKVNTNYAPVGTVQSPGELSTSVSDNRRAYLNTGYLTATSATDTAVQALYLQSAELTFDTQLLAEADAQGVCDNRYNFYRVRHDLYNLRVKMGSTLLAAIDLGSIVQLTLPYFGLSGGKLAVITGLQVDAAAEIVNVRVLT